MFVGVFVWEGVVMVAAKKKMRGLPNSRWIFVCKSSFC